MGIRQPRKLTPFLLPAIVVLVMLQSGCKGSTTPDPPPPPPTQYNHDITIATPLDMETGAQIISGSFTVILNSQIYNGTFGQKLTLPRTTKQTELCEVTITAAGYLTRKYKKGQIVEGTTLAPTLVILSFPIADYLQLIRPDGKNGGWVPRDIKVSFNPDPSTGLRLPDSYLDMAKQTIDADPASADIKHYSYIHNWKEYYVKSVTYDPNGSRIIDTTVPPDGEVWVFRRSDSSGATDVSYPGNGAPVTAVKAFFNMDSSDPTDVHRELRLGIFNLPPGHADFPQVPQWACLMFNRPTSSDYVIGLTEESQDDFDARSTSTPTSNLRALGSTVDPSLFNQPLAPGGTSAPSLPGTPLLQKPNLPSTTGQPPASPSQTGPSRPLTKKRIHN